MHFRVVSTDQDKSAIDTGVGKGEERICGNVDAHMFHGDQCPATAKRGADTHL